MPRVKKDTVVSRSHVSLDPSSGRHPQTSKRRAQCLERFLVWLSKELGQPVDLPHLDNADLNAALIGFGKRLFYTGEPKYMFSETINAVVDKFPHLRGQLAAPWTTLSRWEAVEPVARSMVMPASVFQAGVSLSLLWNWPRMAAALLIGFHGFLRPNEFLPLQRVDLILPRDVLSSEPICYIRIWHSKTSRFMLRQHARISDHMTVVFLDHVFGALPPTDLLFGCSSHIFRNRWNKVFSFLGLNISDKANGITPKSLRGSRASWFFHQTEDLSRVLWRGRWQARRTWEHYLQDVMGQVLLTDLSPAKRDLVLELATASSSLLYGSYDQQ